MKIGAGFLVWNSVCDGNLFWTLERNVRLDFEELGNRRLEVDATNVSFICGGMGFVWCFVKLASFPSVGLEK